MNVAMFDFRWRAKPKAFACVIRKALLALVLVPFAGWAARQGSILLYPTALKTGVNLLADKPWRAPSKTYAPHAVAQQGRGGPLDADAVALALANDHREFAYWLTLVGGIRTNRTYFAGAWTKMTSARLLFWWNGVSAETGKNVDARVYCFSGCMPDLARYFDDDIRRRLAGDPDEWRLIARTFTLPTPVVEDKVHAEYGFFGEPGQATFAEPFLIDVTEQPQTVEVVLKGVKPVKKLVVIRSDTRDPEWRREFVPPITDFAETLPARIPAFEGMACHPMFGRVLLVSYADGTEDRVACPYEGIFIKR